MKKNLYVLLCVVVIVGGGYLFVSSISFINDIRANRSVHMGHIYAEKVYKEYTILGEICQGVDTDNDGYVSCTFRLSKNAIEKEVNLQCPTFIKSFLGNECKASQYVMPQ